jgi:hypothetical protein
VSGGLVGQVGGQRRTVLKVGQVIDGNQRGDWLSVLAECDGAVALPCLSDELAQVCRDDDAVLATWSSAATRDRISAYLEKLRRPK